MATSWSQGELMLLLLNVAFLFVYVSIPLASYPIVLSASRPLRML